MSARPLADEIREVAEQYPEPRSAVLPALRMAQERHGWLTTEAFREVADALVADMIAIVGSLDNVMGEADR